MKNRYINIISLLLALLMSGQLLAKDNRTLETKVADILAQFPTKDLNHSDKLMQEMIDLGQGGIVKFCDIIIPPGTGDDTQARYALESLARFSGAPKHENAREVTEQSLLKALSKATNKEVKAFFIRRLNYCGTDASIDALGNYLSDDKLFSPAVSALTAIGTDKAGQVILNKLPDSNEQAKIQFVKALGIIKYKPAESELIKISESSIGELKGQSLYALASLALPTSGNTIAKAASEANYFNKDGAMVAYLHYAGELGSNGHPALANELCKQLLKKCKAPEQIHFRSSALNIIRNTQGADAISILIKEFKNSDIAYRQAIMDYASDGMTPDEVDLWIKAMKKVTPEAECQIISTLAKRQEPQVLSECILPSLDCKNEMVRIEAINALVLNQEQKAIPVLLNQLSVATSHEEISGVKTALMGTCSKDNCALLAKKIDTSVDSKKAVLIDVIAAKRATDYFDLVFAQCQSNNQEVKTSAYSALQNVAGKNSMKQLLGLINQTNEGSNIKAVQEAIIAVLSLNEEANNNLVLSELKGKNNKAKLLPVAPYVDDQKSIKLVTDLIETGSSEEKEAALDALSSWRNDDAIPYLFKLSGDRTCHEKAFNAYINQVKQSQYPDDQKLLLVRKAMDVAANTEEKTLVLKAAGNIKTFLSLVFISGYIDNEALSSVASSSAMKVMLPTPGKKDGLTGDFVREVAEKVKAKLTGPDSQYFKIDIQEYLDNMPKEKGYVSIFNGKDLSGWQGLVKNPIERAKMTKEELAKAQVVADAKMTENWSVKDGCIVFNGKGANLCSKKKYGDFEMLVDWRITKKGDSGIYLRGTPQVQIWDTSRVEVGAHVGSGGLYNNKINPSKPLVLADNAIGDWNTFYIKMLGDKVTVYLNGILVVDNVIMENYWDRSMPIFPAEAIELQAHGTDLAFRNIFVREISGGDDLLSDEEKAEGFSSLFNGKDLDYWVGNKTDYLVEDGLIAVRPKQGGHGNLYTAKEYSDFIFRFEFQLTPGANNGLGIHAPLGGDAAYAGKELQILDNTAPIYANLQPYQYHGSVYGIIAAKRGFLKPVGEWNKEEVIVKGDDIKITLNGEVIVDGNVAEASKNGTADHKDHPGLLRHSGHIGFLGHGSELNFRNIRIKELTE